MIIQAPSCPFALSKDFMLHEPRPEKLSPLGELSVFSDQPVNAHLWLSADDGPRQPPEGKLVPGLRRLTHVEEFLIQDAERHALELGMKRRGFDQHASDTLSAEPDSLPAQSEALQMILELLPQRYPDLYAVEKKEDGAVASVTVLSTGETHVVKEYAHCPIELCGRLVQVSTGFMGSQPSLDIGLTLS